MPTPDRRRMFRPDFGVSGPHLPRTRAGWMRVLWACIGIAGFSFIAGALLRAQGVI